MYHGHLWHFHSHPNYQLFAPVLFGPANICGEILSRVEELRKEIEGRRETFRRNDKKLGSLLKDNNEKLLSQVDNINEELRILLKRKDEELRSYEEYINEELRREKNEKSRESGEKLHDLFNLRRPKSATKIYPPLEDRLRSRRLSKSLLFRSLLKKNDEALRILEQRRSLVSSNETLHKLMAVEYDQLLNWSSLWKNVTRISDRISVTGFFQVCRGYETFISQTENINEKFRNLMKSLQ
jgi:hypothetical protein